MPMSPMPPQGAPAPEQPQSSPGGASELVAGLHSGMMKLLDMVSGKFPEIGQKLGAVVQQFQDVIGELGEGSDEAAQQPAVPATTTPEAGAANVKPAM